MFVLQKRLTNFLCSYSSIHLVEECRYASAGSDFNDHIGSKYMQKLLNKRQGGKAKSKTKKKWYESHVADPMELLSLIKEPKNKQGETRIESTRSKQLGHVLYDKITQIINTGELSEEILCKQVFITSVKMLAKFQGVHVYWDNNRSDAAEVDTLLQANAAKLRSILISYHVLGRIPVVTFVKDRLYTDLSRLNQLFEVADYGPDYVPSCQNNSLRNQLFPKRSLEPQPSDAPAVNMNNKMDPGFDRSETTPELEDLAEPAMVENDSQCSDSDNFRPSENDAQSVSLMQGVRFISNVYSLPHDDLMRKVIAQKTTRKCPGDEMTSKKTEAAVDFDVKQLKSKQDQMRLQYVTDSSRFRQRLLERDPEDFVREDDH